MEEFYVSFEAWGHEVPPTNEKRLLRGAQVSDDDGMIEFMTISTGWYAGHVPHIHFRISVDENEIFVSQFYFDDVYCRERYTSREPYSRNGPSPYTTMHHTVNPDGGYGLLINPQRQPNNPVVLEAKIGLKPIG